MKNKASADSGCPHKKIKLEQPSSLPHGMNVESDISDNSNGFLNDKRAGIPFHDNHIPPAAPQVCSYESTGGRLIITHIVTENFKSCAGEVIVGPFDKSFSSIVHPNGSCTSDLIDSMLFVFGDPATEIRSTKLPDLIHKSEQFQNVTSCKVRVHFVQILDKENGDYEKIPGSEFHISRTAFQDSSSSYEVNNRKVQFEEVELTLQEHGINLALHQFLILQDELVQIALMSPKAQHPRETGILEYLENIIGTSRYKDDIEKLQDRLETLNEDWKEKLEELQLVESEQNELKGLMEDTVNFLETENRIAHLKNKRYQFLLYEIEMDVCENEKEKSEIVELNEMSERKLKEMMDQKKASEKEMNALHEKLQKKLKNLEEIHEINKNAEKKFISLTEESNQAKKNRKQTADILKSEEDKLKNLLKELEKNQAQIAELTEEEEELNERRIEIEASIQKVLSSLQNETKKFLTEEDELQAEQIQVKKKYDDSRLAFELAKSERDIYLSNEQNEKSKLERSQAKLGDIVGSLNSKKSDLEDLQKELLPNERDMEKARESLDSMETRASTLTRLLLECQSEIEEIRCAIRPHHSYKRALNFLMEMKASGQLPGLFGRLGNFCAVDEKYDLAMLMASPLLDHVIVDTFETAKKCLKALKDHDMGRCDFVVLSEFEELRPMCNRRREYPENVPCLFDLIRVNDERVKPAIFFAFRRIFVVQDLKQAIRIADGKMDNKQYRFCTLDGDYIEPNGVMTGWMRNTDNSLLEEVSELERKVKQMEEKKHEVKKHEKLVEEILAHQEPFVRALKMDINKLTIEILHLTKLECELKTQLVAQTQKVNDCAPSQKRVKELEQRVQQTEKNAKEAEDSAKAIEEKVAEVRAKIIEITQGRTTEAQKKLDEVMKQWEATRCKITQLQVVIKTSERNAKKACEHIENIKMELEEAEKREKEILDEREKLKNDYESSSKKVAQLKEEIDKKQALYDVLLKERKNFSDVVTSMKAAKLQEFQKLEAVERRINEAKENELALNYELKKLTLHRILEFREPDDEEFEKFTSEQLKRITADEISAALQKEEEFLKTLSPNLDAPYDYEKKKHEFLKRAKELKEITERRNLCQQDYEAARENRLQKFTYSLNIISNKLNEVYQMFSLGGDAKLVLNDGLDPFTEGIYVCVRPPGKWWESTTNLTGNEQMLPSLALMFALQYHRPTPFYVMDDIAAFLDVKNVSIVRNYIKERAKNAQFIVISPETSMIEPADDLMTR